MSLISIIVPVYNSEDVIEICLNSILSSTYRDIEVIIVDDGSTDKTGMLCDKYASKDSRIKVIHKDNEGISKARNTGLKNCVGEYFMFVDSDDYIHPQMIQMLYDTIKTKDYIFVQCQHEIVYDYSHEKKEYYDYCIEATEYSTSLYRKKVCSSNKKYQFVWNKIYNRKKCNVEFSNFAAEDFAYILDLIHCEGYVAEINYTLYYYVQNFNSVSHSKIGSYQFGVIDTFAYYLHIFKDKNLDVALDQFINTIKHGLLYRHNASDDVQVFRIIDNKLKKYGVQIILW